VLVSAAILLLHAGPIEVHFLEPAAHAAAVGTPVALAVSDGGERPLPWAQIPVGWMFVRVAATQRNMDAAPVRHDGSVGLALPLAGVGVIGLDERSQVGTLDLAQLNAFLAERGRLNSPLPEAGPVRLRRVQSMKSVVRAGAPGSEAGASEAVSKTGQQVEIRPLMDPGTTPAGADLAFRAYIQGSGAPGARLIATHAASGAVQDVLCDHSGIGRITITAPGRWRMEMHELRPGDEQAQCILFTATLTFDSPGAMR
jgi:hypothetical protein